MNDRITAIVLLVAAISSPAIAQDRPVVKLSDWEQAANGTGMRFLPLPTLTDEESAGSSLPDQTRDGLFQYKVDLTDVRWADDCRCFRYYQVIVKSTKHGSVTRHKFKAVPSGSFDDQRADVRLTIAEGTKKSTADISLPIASAPGLEPTPLIEVTTPERIAPVKLAGRTNIPITLKNATKRMAVEIPGEILITLGQGELWRTAPVVTAGGAPLKTPFQLKAGATQDVVVTIEPVVQEALRASFIPKDNDIAHTSIAVHVPYRNPIFGNRDGLADLPIPLRFHPNVIALMSALLAGVVLGGLIQWRKYRTVRKWVLATATALAVGLVLELVGVFLVSKGDSKFVIFSFSLDPLQTLPVLLLGIGNGLLGLEAAKRLKFIEDGKGD